MCCKTILRGCWRNIDSISGESRRMCVAWPKPTSDETSANGPERTAPPESPDFPGLSEPTCQKDLVFRCPKSKTIFFFDCFSKSPGFEGLSDKNYDATRRFLHSRLRTSWPFRKHCPESRPATHFKFPALPYKFPVLSQKFPVLLSREFRCKPLNLLACQRSKSH